MRKGDLTTKQKIKLRLWLGLSIFITILTWPFSFLVLLPIDIIVVFTTGFDANLSKRFNDWVLRGHKRIMDAQFRIIFGPVQK